MAGMSQVEELGGNRGRLTVDVSPHEREHAVHHAAPDLAGSVRIPGFRKGKVPRQVLVANVGKDRLWAEAVESHIGGWFWKAAARSGLRPHAAPRYDLALPPSGREPGSSRPTGARPPAPGEARARVRRGGAGPGPPPAARRRGPRRPPPPNPSSPRSSS